MEIKRSSSAVWELAYHIVWCPKYRWHLSSAVQSDLKDLIYFISKDHGWEVKELEVMPDHIHLFIGVPPTTSIVTVVHALKGRTSRILFQRFPSLRSRFWRGHLWSPSYYVGSVGHVSEETVAKYVRDQKVRAARGTG